MNFKQADAEVRARLALYYQVAEQGVFLKESKQKSNDLVKQRFNFLTTNCLSLDQPDP